MGGVVRTDEEVRTRAGKPLDAAGEGSADGVKIARFPGQHAASHGDAVQADVGMLVEAEFLLPVAGYRLETLGSTRHAVRNDADVPHPPASSDRPVCRSHHLGGRRANVA
jgi:hypothetical protein